MELYFLTRTLIWRPTLTVIVLCGIADAMASPSSVCRYSVRDVGFVNVHGAPRQLVLLRQPGGDPADQSDWQATIANQLKDSNVTHQWVPSDSPDGRQLLRQFQDHADLPLLAALRGPSDRLLPLPVEGLIGRVEFQQMLRQIIHSPARDRILDHVASALCVIVVVQSGDAALDQSALQAAEQATQQIASQMWMMEKPTERGPVVEVITADQRPSEHWLLVSLGLDRALNEPQVAIVFGQGRRLGDSFAGGDITASKLVQLASVTGQSCECELDRTWLYGTQMIHQWGEHRRTLAENQLDFDPAAALVIAEVNTIIQRIGGNRRSDNLLGNGLKIHDLSVLDSKPQQASANAGDVDADRVHQRLKSETHNKPGNDDDRVRQSSPSGGTDDSAGNRDRDPAGNARWILLLIVGGIVFCAAVFAAIRGKEN